MIVSLSCSPSFLDSIFSHVVADRYELVSSGLDVVRAEVGGVFSPPPHPLTKFSSRFRAENISSATNLVRENTPFRDLPEVRQVTMI